MKTIKVSEATGPALDWLVAKCEGEDYLPEVSYDGIGNEYPATRYSTDWAQAGPIIGREKITVVCAQGNYNQKKAGTADCYDTYWVAEQGWQSAEPVYGPQGDNWGYQFQISEENSYTGSTPLIAAMRCYCCNKLGPEAKVPEELLND